MRAIHLSLIALAISAGYVQSVEAQSLTPGIHSPKGSAQLQALADQPKNIYPSAKSEKWHAAAPACTALPRPRPDV